MVHPTTTQDIETLLRTLLFTEDTNEELESITADAAKEGEVPTMIRSAQTFKAAGWLTQDNGVILTLNDASQFQIMVRQRR